MRMNKLAPAERTHGGAKATRINPELQLRRSVMANMLWENTFYEDGQSVASRITEIIPKVHPDKVAAIAIEARVEMKLRHVPLLLCRELARNHTLKAETLTNVIRRADELTEFLALYWIDGKVPLSNQVKKGLAEAFKTFNAYQLAKYDRKGAVKLRDVLRLVHPRPENEEQAKLWKDVLDGTLATPGTWENKLSLDDGKSKKDKWIDLIKENKLGCMALIRNLRNMEQAGVDDILIKGALLTARIGMTLPFRFITAAKHAPRFEQEIETVLLKSLANSRKLHGKTILIVDVSGSMYNASVSERSEMDRATAACSLAILVRELSEDVRVYATAGCDYNRIHETQLVPSRHGFALSDAIYRLCSPLGGGGIFLKQVMDFVKNKEKDADRIIVITDEQDCDSDSNSPGKADAFGKHNYLINVATDKNGIGYHKWTHIDGWSEAVLDYIVASEMSGSLQ